MDPEITAIVVSEETKGGGEAGSFISCPRSLVLCPIVSDQLIKRSVNKERAKKHLSTLEDFVIKLISSDAEVEDAREETDTAKSKTKIAGKMGSTAIREWIEEQIST